MANSRDLKKKSKQTREDVVLTLTLDEGISLNELCIFAQDTFWPADDGESHPDRCSNTWAGAAAALNMTRVGVIQYVRRTKADPAHKTNQQIPPTKKWVAVQVKIDLLEKWVVRIANLFTGDRKGHISAACACVCD